MLGQHQTGVKRQLLLEIQLLMLLSTDTQNNYSLKMVKSFKQLIK